MSAPQTEKKKSSCLALGGAGCLIVLILLVAGAGIVWMKFGPEIQAKIGEFQKDPERAAVMLIVEKHPDFEKISVDDEKRIVTFKVKSTGEVITATFTALLNSKISTTNGKTEITGLEKYDPNAPVTPPAETTPAEPKAP